jgi:hypothetical protein
MAKDGKRTPRRWAGLADPMMVSVVALGITQITAWGTSYYCLGVLAGPISQDTGWSRGFVFLGFTVALLVMGVVSTVWRPRHTHPAPAQCQCADCVPNAPDGVSRRMHRNRAARRGRRAPSRR